MIEATDLHRTYRRPRTSLLRRGAVVHALRGVSLRLDPGGRLGVVGESGAGKSTLIKLLARLDRPTSGTIRFQGKDITALPERELGFLRSSLQMVFQDPMSSLDPRMRVRDIIAEPLRATGRESRRTRVTELLDAVGLPAAAAERFPHQFSGGQRQRISIARALAPQPDVLIADEPVSALDVSVRAQILNLIADLADEFGLSLILVSHDLGVVRHLCRDVAVLRDGAVVETGPVEQVWREPQHEYTRSLLAATPSLHEILAER